MIICKRPDPPDDLLQEPATSDDHLGEGVHQGDRGDRTEGGEGKLLQTGGRASEVL